MIMWQQACVFGSDTGSKVGSTVRGGWQVDKHELWTCFLYRTANCAVPSDLITEDVGAQKKDGRNFIFLMTPGGGVVWEENRC